MQCQFCQYYQGLGRQGGDCQRLGAPVQGAWLACCMATSVFDRVTPAAVPPSEVSPVAINALG